MKKGLFIILLLFLNFIPSPVKAQQVFYDGENNGQLLLTVIEENVKKKEAVELAIKDAYFQVLFRGIPGSPTYGKALLGTDENAVTSHSAYFDNMIRQGRLYSFVNYSSLTQYKKKVAKVMLTLNMQALVADLERNNLYRRFGIY